MTITILNDAIVDEIVRRCESMMGPGSYKEAMMALIRSQEDSVVLMERDYTIPPLVNGSLADPRQGQEKFG